MANSLFSEILSVIYFLKTVLEINKHIKSNLSFEATFSLLEVIKCINIIQFIIIAKTVGNKVVHLPLETTLYHSSLCYLKNLIYINDIYNL